MAIPAVLIDKYTGEILNPNANYPNADGSPIIGLQDNLQYLIKHVPFERPDVDYRIHIVEEDLPDIKDIVLNSQLDQLPDHPQYPGVKAYEKKWKSTKRDNEYIKAEIDNAEENANRELVTYRTDDKLQMLAIGIIIRKVFDGIEPKASEVEILNTVKAFDVPIWQNDNTKKIKKDQVDAGQEPNLDEGWVKSLSESANA